MKNVFILNLLLAVAGHAQFAALHVEAHRPLIRLYQPQSSTPTGYTPAQVRHAYGVDQIANQGEGQIIGVVDGYDYPVVESDLAVFNTTFGLPPCTIANGCLTVVYASGTKPEVNRGWSGETALDLQWAHAIAPKAKLVLVECENGFTSTLLAGVPIAVAHGATVINMSWGTVNEPVIEERFDKYFFNDPAVTYFNASGDSGYNKFGYPGASPLVVGAGGTTLRLNPDNTVASETAWSGSGGGQSEQFAEPPYQLGFQSSGKRGIPDVAWNSDPSTGVATYDSLAGDWVQVGGTSAASPQWAALTAIANSLRAQMGKGTIGFNFLNVVYTNPLAFRDITQGKNGSCGAVCTAVPGYDFVTGLGSPSTASAVVGALVAAP